MRNFLRLRLLIYILVMSAVVITGFSTYFWSSELGPNLFSEAVGVAFTIFVVEALLRYEDSRRNLPARYAAFRDALLIYYRFLSLWQAMLRASYAPQHHRKILEENKSGILDAGLRDIVRSLNLAGGAPVTPKRSWRQHLHEQTADLENRIDRCLQRYAVFMEPELIHVLQNLERTSFLAMGKILMAIPSSDLEMGIATRDGLGCRVIG